MSIHIEDNKKKETVREKKRLKQQERNETTTSKETPFPFVGCASAPRAIKEYRLYRIAIRARIESIAETQTESSQTDVIPQFASSATPIGTFAGPRRIDFAGQ